MMCTQTSWIVQAPIGLQVPFLMFASPQHEESFHTVMLPNVSASISASSPPSSTASGAFPGDQTSGSTGCVRQATPSRRPRLAGPKRVVRPSSSSSPSTPFLKSIPCSPISVFSVIERRRNAKGCSPVNSARPGARIAWSASASARGGIKIETLGVICREDVHGGMCGSRIHSKLNHYQSSSSLSHIDWCPNILIPLW